MMKRVFTIGVLTTALSLAGFASSAQAIIIGASPNAALTDPFTISFGDPNQASYTFTATSAFRDTVRVETNGAALVASSLGQPTSFDEGTLIRDFILSSYLPYPDPAPIFGSGSEAFVGLKFQLDDGFHFGYALVDGNLGLPQFTARLISFAYETEVGEPIIAGAEPVVTAVPAPATLSLLGLGFGLIGLGAARRRRLALRS